MAGPLVGRGMDPAVYRCGADRPRRALVAALASVSSAPVMVGIAIATGNTSFRPSPLQFFFVLVFPYLLVVVMAYVGASPPRP